jgi:hypothetical protein
VQQRDYIERLIEQIVSAVARIAGLTQEAKLDEAEHELDETWTAVLGFRRADAARLDDDTLRMLLGAKAECAATLFEAEASLEEARGNPAAAESLRRRASRIAR